MGAGTNPAEQGQVPQDAIDKLREWGGGWDEDNARKALSELAPIFRKEVLGEVVEALLAVGVEAAAKRRWEMSQSTGPFAALGPCWEDLRRDVHLRERADLKPQYEKALVASRREIETAVDAALGCTLDISLKEEL